MEMTFDKSVDILVKAYLNDTLVHSDLCGCAVGNLLRGCGVENPKYWYSALFATRGSRETNFEELEYIERGKEELKSIGYSLKEIDRIERTFEKKLKLPSDYNTPVNRRDTYDGLMAVVDVLADIHGIDLEKKEEAKSLFVKECV